MHYDIGQNNTIKKVYFLKFYPSIYNVTSVKTIGLKITSCTWAASAKTTSLVGRDGSNAYFVITDYQSQSLHPRQVPALKSQPPVQQCQEGALWEMLGCEWSRVTGLVLLKEPMCPFTPRACPFTPRALSGDDEPVLTGWVPLEDDKSPPS